MAIRAALVWMAGEFMLVTIPLAVYVVSLIRRNHPLGPQVLNIQLMLMGFSMTVMAFVFYRYTRRESLTYKELGYRMEAGMVGVGLLAAILLIPFIEAADRLDHAFFPSSRAVDELIDSHRREGGAPTAALMLSINGLLGPVVEEFAWRGYIQSHLPGVRGLPITALLFAAKHVVTDLSVVRLTVLLLASFALGAIRYRWSTTSSTVAHVSLNIIASLWSITDGWSALRGQA